MKTQKQLIHQFTDPTRSTMRGPFIINDTVYATNGHVLLWFPVDKLQEPLDEVLEKFPAANAVIPKDNACHLVDATALKAAIASAKDSFNAIYESREVCPNCNGTGKAEWAHEDVFGEDHILKTDCPICECEGEYPHFIYRHNSKILPEPKSLIKLFGVMVQEKYLQAVLLLTEYCGVHDVFVNYISTDFTRIVLETGYYRLLIMAVAEKGTDDVLTELVEPSNP